ncbi:erythromycin esterase family protein [Zunongwangia endophytica]|uniref:Erythromycin esterase family protein n=1 Tax=Zunongwangia endophytica TaxID=1808945 RepID=A0ABV8HD84_9FLAO|nr:erythromycin esterase family protein [Zunongwangia endophytica]MDN3593479.1 erythromycin esterase family protein [Zunongwangia endophytica]
MARISMKNRITILIFLISFSKISFAQIEKHIYQMNSIDKLLTEDVKNIVSENIDGKRIVFLGESAHHIGSDFLAKTEFVKYLVNERGYKNIVFESDFFGLYFDHKKYNIFPHWTRSVQCQDLFKFVEENEITIWGLDNQTHSYFTYHNFAKKLSEYLKQNNISVSDRFIPLTDKFIKTAGDELGKDEVGYLLGSLDLLLSNEKINPLWHQFLESFKSTVEIYTIHSSKKEGIPIRDEQMAKNLDFLVNQNPEKKFIVWVANAHMAKVEKDFMEGQTMGSDFVKMNPNISYHLAFTYIHMPWIKERKVEKAQKNQDNLLRYLPDTNQNYFIDSNGLIEENIEFSNKEYDAFFGLNSDITNYFKQFDALIYIGKGIRSKLIEYE